MPERKSPLRNEDLFRIPVKANSGTRINLARYAFRCNANSKSSLALGGNVAERGNEEFLCLAIQPKRGTATYRNNIHFSRFRLDSSFKLRIRFRNVNIQALSSPRNAIRVRVVSRTYAP